MLGIQYLGFWPDPYVRNYRPCFHENQSKRSFLLIENEHFGLVFVKTGSINSATIVLRKTTRKNYC
jgi:hypothetical protein